MRYRCIFFTYNINALLTVKDRPHGPSGGPRHPGPRHKFSAALEPLTLTPIRWARCPHAWAFQVVDDRAARHPWIPRVQHALYCSWACPAQHLDDSGWLDRLHTAGVHDGGMAAVPRSISVLFLLRFLPLNHRFQRSATPWIGWKQYSPYFLKFFNFIFFSTHK